MNLDYLQGSHEFHVERIMDYLSVSLPLCAVHQARMVLFFCYIFVGVIEFLLYPPYNIGGTPFDRDTLLIPVVIVSALHVLLAISYAFGAMFERASWTTAMALLHLFHAPLALGILVWGCVQMNRQVVNFEGSIGVATAASAAVDLLCGLLSRPGQRVFLTFEAVFVVPCAVLVALDAWKVIHNPMLCFIPAVAFFALYGFSVTCLGRCCPLRRFCLRTLRDVELAEEFAASVDPQLKPFKTRADWADDGDVTGNERMRRRSESLWERAEGSRFPAKSYFQLYNLTMVERPVYLASPAVFLAVLIVAVISALYVWQPFADFYLWFAASLLLVVIAVVLNSRAAACSCLAVTNIDDAQLSVLWDHPALSVL